jgi:aminoglycoside phosphotransferase family enzyme/predicted kinase
MTSLPDGSREADTAALIQRLLSPAAYPHAVSDLRLIETHISWVFLTGDSVYKLKKPVNFGFLDFGSLERRRHFCEEEVRLNRRFAPELYLDVVPISGPPCAARVGGAGEPIEWAVRLRQFDESGRLDRMLEGGRLSAEGVLELAEELARVQDRLEIADGATPWGTHAAVSEAVDATLAQLRHHRPDLHDRVDTLERLLQNRMAGCSAAFEDRRRAGRVRQCHGDLHLANLVRHEGRFLAFDSIEFSDSLRWIDVASDIAFLAMDLESRDRGDLAAVFLSGWIEAANDHQATSVLPVYMAYRAVVRAAVAAIRAVQAQNGQHPDVGAATAARRETDRYLAVAERLSADRRPVMFATSGVSGSGKTTVAGKIVAAIGGIRLRSDVERKRCFGMRPTDRPPDAATAAALYSEEATTQTYERLAKLARLMLDCGASVVIDAACNRRQERRILAAAACEAGVPLVWLAIEAPEETVLARVAAREAAGTDASDASAAVVRAQLAAHEPILPEEFGRMPSGEPCERVVRLEVAGTQ